MGCMLSCGVKVGEVMSCVNWETSDGSYEACSGYVVNT